jgi:hypothetical protein
MAVTAAASSMASKASWSNGSTTGDGSARRDAMPAGMVVCTQPITSSRAMDPSPPARVGRRRSRSPTVSVVGTMAMPHPMSLPTAYGEMAPSSATTAPMGTP